MKKINLNTLKEIISNNNQFIILTHQNPDGDTIGSSIALSCLLKKLNKKTYLEIEEKLRTIAKIMKMSLAEMDLYLFYLSAKRLPIK